MIFFLLSANLMVVAGGMHFGWPSPSMPILEQGNYTFAVTYEESSYIAVMPLIGKMFGSLINGVMNDVIGRKNTVAFSSFNVIAAWLTIGLATTPSVMLVGRFVGGISEGLSFNAVPMYLGEIASPNVRGLLASLCPVSRVFGILLIYILGAYLPLHVVAFASITIPVIYLVTFIRIPESPYYYLIRGDVTEAVRSLQKLRGQEDVIEELARISSAVKEQNEVRRNLLDVFKVKSNRKGFLICCGKL